MKYENEMTCCVVEDESLLKQNLTGELKETRALAGDVSWRARRIKEHLFGPEPEKTTGEAKNAGPACFQDELREICRCLAQTNSVLAEIMERLGAKE